MEKNRLLKIPDRLINKKNCNFFVNSSKSTISVPFVDTSNKSKKLQFEMLNASMDKIEEENFMQVITNNVVNYKAAR